ncbi:MAG: threonine/serine exporter family protein, partial [Paramuribaculum sp.]|nr:threonine/serine exporter family protein [Paramuribaculum sp.]
MLIDFIQDIIFSAIAAIGFAAISNPPRNAYVYCALIAAAGHSSRFLLMNIPGIEMHIVAASTIAAFIIGVLSGIVSPRTRVPAETYLYPA